MLCCEALATHQLLFKKTKGATPGWSSSHSMSMSVAFQRLLHMPNMAVTNLLLDNCLKLDTTQLSNTWTLLRDKGGGEYISHKTNLLSLLKKLQPKQNSKNYFPLNWYLLTGVLLFERPKKCQSIPPFCQFQGSPLSGEMALNDPESLLHYHWQRSYQLDQPAENRSTTRGQLN